MVYDGVIPDQDLLPFLDLVLFFSLLFKIIYVCFIFITGKGYESACETFVVVVVTKVASSTEIEQASKAVGLPSFITLVPDEALAKSS